MEYCHGDRVGAAGVVATIQLMIHLHLFQIVNAADHRKKYVMTANQLVKIWIQVTLNQTQSVRPVVVV